MTSDVNPKTILLRGDPLGGEGNASDGNVRPGHLVSALPDGAVSRAGAGTTVVAFAREPDYAGQGIGHEFASGERVPYWNARKGDWMYALLATGESVSAGELLEAGANGVLIEQDSGTAIARALEDLDNEYGDGPAHIRVEVI